MILTVSSPATALAADPVEDLLQTLRQVHGQSFDTGDAKQVAQYKKLVKDKADKIVRAGDLRKVLLSDELRATNFLQEPGVPQEDQHPLGKTVQEIRGQLAGRLEDALRSALKASDSVRRLAVVTFLRDMARQEEEFAPNDERGAAVLASRFTPRLAPVLGALALARNEGPDVRAAAIQALVQIAPGDKKTLDALEPLLHAERTDIERQAAAESLGQMIRLLRVGPPVRQPGGGRRPLPPAVQVVPRVVAAAGLGLDDKDVKVRSLCLDAIRESVQSLMNLPKAERPPANAPPVPGGGGERLDPKGGGPERQSVQLLVGVVNKQMPGVRRNLSHSDPALRLAAHQVLETFASLRLKLAGKHPPKEEKEWFVIEDAVPELAKNSLSHEDVRTRLAALYVLETLGQASAPAVQELARTLKDDKNGFVRWGAARTLNNMAPERADEAVPALAGALKDNNQTVRLTAVVALEHYGPRSVPAVKPLVEMVGDKQDARMRVGAIRALVAIGKEARPAAAVLVTALADPESGVRAAAAAALGQLGDLDKTAKKELARMLNDSDPAVRQAASDALLGDKPEPRR
jgi:HEAT repeat protein